MTRHIAIVTRFYSPRIAGAEAITARLAHYIASTKDACEVITTRHRGGLPRLATEQGIRLRRLGTVNGRLSRPVEFARSLLYFLIHGHRFAIVQAMCLSSFSLGALIGAKARGARTIIVPCTVGPSGDIAKIMSFPGGHLLWRLFLRADIMLAHSNVVTEELRRYDVPESKVALLPGFSLSGQEPPTTTERAVARARVGLPNRPTVLFVGRLERAKGVDVLLDVWGDLVDGQPATLVLVGDGPLRDEALRAARSLSVGYIHAVGWQTDPTPYYEAADVFVSPSRSETFGLAIADAMAYGLPVVVTPTGLAGPWIKGESDGGKLVPHGDKGALLAALRQVLSDEEYRLALGQRARRRAKLSFRQDVVGQSYSALWDRMLCRSPSIHGKHVDERDS